MAISNVGICAVRQKSFLNTAAPKLEKRRFAFVIAEVGVCPMSEQNFGCLRILRSMKSRSPLVVLHIHVNSR